MDVDTEGKSIEEIDELIQSYLGLSFKEEPSLPDIDYDNIQLPPDTENTETHRQSSTRRPSRLLSTNLHSTFIRTRTLKSE